MEITTLCEKYYFTLEIYNEKKNETSHERKHTMQVACEEGVEVIEYYQILLPKMQRFSAFLDKAQQYLEENSIDAELPPDPSLAYYKKAKELKVSNTPKPLPETYWRDGTNYE